MSHNISCYNFPENLKVKEQNQTIEFHLPIYLPQRVRKLFNNEIQFSNIKIKTKSDKVYYIEGGDENERTSALLYIFKNIDWHGKPLFDSECSSYNFRNHIKDGRKVFNRNSFSLRLKYQNYNKYYPKLDIQNNKENNTRPDINNKPNEHNYEAMSIDEIPLKLSYYQNVEIKNIDKKIYEDIDKFSGIIDFITSLHLDDHIKVPLFIQFCKIFSRQDLMNSTNSNQIESIYSIFFDPIRKIFKLKSFFESAIIHFILGKFDDFKPIFHFFHSLISVSSNYAEMIKTDIKLLTKLALKYPDFKDSVDELIEFAEKRKQMDFLESSISPTMNDLFFTNDSIQNGIDHAWDSFIEYKKAMIDLTKLNFYLPFKTNLKLLRESTIDARDLYLYQNVTINFESHTSYFQYFNDCNLFLRFQIRVPPNWKREILEPDWQHSERLANRSLLILSTDPNLHKFDAVCRSCAIARYDDDIGRLSRDLLNNGIVPVTLISGQLCENKSYYMFEPTSSWSSIQPVLQSLSQMSILTFPEKFIKIVTKMDFSDNYESNENAVSTDVLQIHTNKSLFHQLQLQLPSKPWIYDEFSDQQKDTLLRVDHEQYKALRYCLLHNLTLVNGAPGTGKTHLAREIIRILDNTRNMKPIAVISYTNHALDSLLEDVIKFVNSYEIIRWGGPSKSENINLKYRKWSGKYFGIDIREQRDNIATKKQQLKNLYNIRQMASNYIRFISSDPYNVNYYYQIIEFLKQFIQNIEEKFYMKYPLPFNDNEILYYDEYLNSKKAGVQKVKLPDVKDEIKCWLYGNDYYKQRNERLIEIYNSNQKAVIGNTTNRFQYLLEEEENKEVENKEVENKEVENKEVENPEKNIETEEGNKKATKIEEKIIEEEEEINDDSFDEKIYGDEDMIEMVKNSFLDANIYESFNSQYVKRYIKEKFDILFSSSNNSPEAMIRYLKEISAPLTEMINEYEKQLQKEETDFLKSETTSAGIYLQKMKLIGMTSTIASCHKESLEIAGCETVIVEEAGELTESMLSCILPKTMKRLILIGDYQQLRPKVEYELTMNPYNYDISLFEKLVKNAMNQKADCLFTLSIQRRMHPQISRLVRESFYQEGIEKMMDDQSTNNYGIPFGIPYRVRFIMHDYEMKSAGRSYSNNKEAKFCAALIPFFICRGYKPEDITIISLYKGQKYEIEKEIANLFYNKRLFNKEFDSFGNVTSPKEFKVVVLDNFQGEENKVIIVSLTRSDKPGFVKNRNRALVTLSRAKEMLVVLGNRKIFGKDCKNNKLWEKISEVASNISPYSMSTDECPGLAVNHCAIHNKMKNMPAFLKTPEELIKYRFSFCKERCNYILKCGHPCKLPCHCNSSPPGPHEHDNYICQFRCEKKCPNNHRCIGTCGLCSKNGCPKCKVIIHHVFEKCHHEADIECYLVTSNKAKCHAKCGKKLERCGHLCNLTCGHNGPCDCQTELNATCPNCKRNIRYKCGRQPVCYKNCNYKLPCGHMCSNKCIECIQHGHNFQCQMPCNFVFPCGHRCTCKCSDNSEEHQHQLCHQLIKIGSIMQECCKEISFNQNEKFICPVCHKERTHFSKGKNINRCICQCTKTCPKCGKRCRALTGEKCAFFCVHSDLGENNEPPEEAGPVFLFHGNHYLLLKDAIKKVKNFTKKMIKGGNNCSMARFRCPIRGCKCVDPCIIGSWLFDDFNIEIEKKLASIRK